MSVSGKERGKSQDSGWRGSAEGWLEAAYDALKESGVDAVRVMPLAKRLNLSRTSFYWFFQDREQLLAALLARCQLALGWLAAAVARAQTPPPAPSADAPY